MDKVKIVLVDDHPVVREGLRTMLSTSPDIEVVAEASDGLEAIDRVNNFHPDVVLMDVRMPNMDGLEATRRIKSESPSTLIIVLTMHDDEAYIVDAIKAGAAGYLLKDSPIDLLFHAIRVAISGGMIIKPGLLREAIASLGDKTGITRTGKSAGIEKRSRLTAREQEVLHLIVLGQSNREIGEALSISEDTAKKHIQNIMLKLGVSDRTQAAVKAVCYGLVNQLPDEET